MELKKHSKKIFENELIAWCLD